IVGTIGTTVDLSAEVAAAGSDAKPSQQVTWVSSNDDIATVDEDGQVTITGIGVAEISVSSNQAPGIVGTIEVIGAESALVTEFEAEPLEDGSGGWQLSWAATGHLIELDGVAMDDSDSVEVNPS